MKMSSKKFQDKKKNNLSQGIGNFMKIFSFILLIQFLFLSSGCNKIVKPIAGNFNLNVDEARKELSLDTKKFLENIFKDVDKKCFMDTHVHAVGLGSGGTKNWVNPVMRTWTKPKELLRFFVYMSASGVTDI